MSTSSHLNPVVEEAIKSLDLVKVTQATLVHKIKIAFGNDQLPCHPLLVTRLADIAKKTPDEKVAILCGEAIEEAGLSDSGDAYIVDIVYDAVKSRIEDGNLFLAAKLLQNLNNILSRQHEFADDSHLEKFQALADIAPPRTETTAGVNDSRLARVFHAQTQTNPHDRFAQELKAMQNIFDMRQISKFDKAMKTSGDDKSLLDAIRKPIENAIPKEFRNFLKDLRKRS